MSTQNWDVRFLDLAKFISSWSKDPSTKVGAVIVDNNKRIVSVGYNGFPKGIDDDHRLHDREAKYLMIVHGEMNAILFANRSLKDCTLYTYPFMPCPRCTSMIIQTGITKVIAPKNKNSRWEKEFVESRNLFSQAGVSLSEIEYNNAE